ncbi:MAG: cell division protein FtsL [Candidatus Bipolaricaulota bacterium]|nr:cell division protein FtsL [Candidatus Bipolaricaulota bacterium]
MGRSFVSLFVLGAITALAIWYVWQGWQITDLSSKVIASRLERDELLAQRDRFKLEVIRVWSLENIERIARERLGMKKIPPKTLKLPAPHP